MGAMTGGLYQLLLQSKLLITAVMMKQLKGTTQSGLADFVVPGSERQLKYALQKAGHTLWFVSRKTHCGPVVVRMKCAAVLRMSSEATSSGMC